MRAELGLTQAQLAARLGVTVQSVGRWESFRPPRGETLDRLAEWAKEAGSACAWDFRALREAESDPLLRFYPIATEFMELIQAMPPEEAERMIARFRREFLDPLTQMVKSIGTSTKGKKK
jgi:transcriptional regulator with XRE-family HTH domain